MEAELVSGVLLAVEHDIFLEKELCLYYHLPLPLVDRQSDRRLLRYIPHPYVRAILDYIGIYIERNLLLNRQAKMEIVIPIRLKHVLQESTPGLCLSCSLNELVLLLCLFRMC